MQSQHKFPSPDKRYDFLIHSWEARMSLWVESPSLYDHQTKQILFRFHNPNWSLEKAEWENDTVVVLTLQKFPGAHTPPFFEVTIDCNTRTATMSEIPRIPLRRLERILNRLARSPDRWSLARIFKIMTRKF